VRKDFVPPRVWIKVAHKLYVYFKGDHNTWVEHDSGHVKFGAKGDWGIHRGPVDSLPTSWNRVTEKRTVTRID
jgi:hypothetical protein